MESPPRGVWGDGSPQKRGGLGGASPREDTDPDFGSTAHVARLLGAPVVLVVDAARAGRSVAALVAGFAAFDPRTPVPGVILNRVASDRHERLLREALAASGVTVYGAIRRTDGIRGIVLAHWPAPGAGVEVSVSPVSVLLACPSGDSGTPAGALDGALYSASTSLPPAISRPSSSTGTSGDRKPVILPSYMTAIRSASA